MIRNIKKLFHSKMAQNGMWLIVLQGFNTVIPLITLPYITRILSSSAYGEFSLALNWVGYFQVIVEYGFGLTGARKVVMRESDDELGKIHSNIIFSRLLLLIVCFGLFWLIVAFTAVDKTQLICMLILFLMVLAVAFQQTWFFQGIAEMKNITIINVFSRTASVVLIFLLVRDPSDLYLYCLLYVSNFIIASVVGCLVVWKKYGVCLQFTGIRAVIAEIKDGWYLFVSSAMTKIFGSIGITILGIVATKSAVGIYSAINKIPYVFTLLFSAISQAVYPYICKQYNVSFQAGIRYVKQICIPIIVLFSFFGFVIILLHYPIVKIAFGEEYAADSLLLLPFVIWVIVGIINNFLGIQTLVASGHQKEYSRSFMVSVAIMLVLMFILGYLWSAFGIATASMLSEICLSLLLYRHIRKLKKTESE